MKLFRCWGIQCHVWYFGGVNEPEENAGVCPSCGEEGVRCSVSEETMIERIWHHA